MNPYEEFKEQMRRKAQQQSGVVHKGARVASYFKDRYGEHNAKFICSRLAPVLDRWTEDQLIRNGEKIALMNGWVSLEELMRRGI